MVSLPFLSIKLEFLESYTISATLHCPKQYFLNEWINYKILSVPDYHYGQLWKNKTSICTLFSLNYLITYCVPTLCWREKKNQLLKEKKNPLLTLSLHWTLIKEKQTTIFLMASWSFININNFYFYKQFYLYNETTEWNTAEIWVGLFSHLQNGISKATTKHSNNQKKRKCLGIVCVDGEG